MVRPGWVGRGRMAALCATVLWMAGAMAADPRADLEGGETVKVALTDEGGEVTALLRVGTAQPGVTMTLTWSDGKQTRLRAQSAPVPYVTSKKEKGKPAIRETTSLPDGCVAFPELRVNLYVRPNLKCYGAAQAEEVAKKWDDLPAASAREFAVAFRPDASGLQYWIDGRYAGRVDTAAKLRDVTFQPAPVASVRNARRVPATGDARFLPLDVSRIARPGAMKDARSSLEPGVTVIGGTPFLVPAAKDNADVGVVKEMSSGGMELDPYLSRTAFDGMPESLHFSAPLAQYIRAWVLCAVEDDPAKDPVLTARLTRFASDGHGGAIADTSVQLPRGDAGPTAGQNRVGAVTYSAQGMKRTVPLWLVEIPLKVGEIQDLVFIHKDEACNAGMLPDRRYLDFEFVGKLGEPFADGEQPHKPLASSVSGVHVFAVTLERSPVEMECRQSQVGNVFQGAEKVEIPVALTPRAAGKYALAWQVADVAGAVVEKGERSVEFAAAGPEQIVAVPLGVKEKGWYGVRFELKEAQGRVLVEHSAALALLAEDTRRAGYESPYGTWWFGTAHRGTDNPAIGGPLMLRAGLRHTVFGWHKLTEADMVPWKATAFQVPWLWRLSAEGDLETKARKYEDGVREYLKKWPSCRQAIIFHESFSGDTLPVELTGAAPAPMKEDEAKAAQNRWDAASTVTKVLREKFPNLKIVFGNCNSTAELAAQFIRKGYPKSNIDALGVEAAGQSFIPERLTEWGTQAAWVARETARKLGCDLPVTCCYEWLYRCQRRLGPERFAEWHARDALIAHAYGFSNISLALLYDAGNCYFNSLWGGAGLCQRYPLLYPKPAYVAYANLTRVLDDVRFLRRVPTGSPTLYALEFARDDKFICVLWTPRGECSATIKYARDTATHVVDLYGRTRPAALRNGELAVTASTAPQYLISSAAVSAVSAGKRSFPQDAAPAKTLATSPMERAEEWQLAVEADPRLEAPTRTHLPLRHIGKYSLRAAQDAEKGSCLELELTPEGTVPDVLNEYAVLKLREPLAVPGEPSTVGLWVKGNSGWGRVMWEFEDAEGKSFLSSGTGGWGCDILDWPGDISINFDGWCFLRFPINEQSPAKVITPGGVHGQWVAGKGKTKDVVYPIKLTGIAVEMTRKTLDLTEMVPVSPTIRLKGLCAF